MPLTEAEQVLAPVGDALSGKLGAVVYSHNRHGPYNYKVPSRTNPNTPRQQVVRSVMFTASRYWWGVPQTWRDGWQTYAENARSRSRVGLSTRLTGFQHFVGCLLTRSSVGQIFPPQPPTEYTRARLTTPSYTVFIGAFIMATYFLDDPWRTDSLGAIVLQSSPPQTANVNAWHGVYRRIGASLGDPVSPPLQGLFRPAWPPAPGRRYIFIRARCVQTDNRTSTERLSRLYFP